MSNVNLNSQARRWRRIIWIKEAAGQQCRLSIPNTPLCLLALRSYELKYERCMAIIFTRVSAACDTHHTLRWGLFMASMCVKHNENNITWSKMMLFNLSAASVSSSPSSADIHPLSGHCLVCLMSFLLDRRSGGDALPMIVGGSGRWNADTTRLDIHQGKTPTSWGKAVKRAQRVSYSWKWCERFLFGTVCALGSMMKCADWWAQTHF